MLIIFIGSSLIDPEDLSVTDRNRLCTSPALYEYVYDKESCDFLCTFLKFTHGVCKVAELNQMDMEDWKIGIGLMVLSTTTPAVSVTAQFSLAVFSFCKFLLQKVQMLQGPHGDFSDPCWWSRAGWWGQIRGGG